MQLTDSPRPTGKSEYLDNGPFRGTEPGHPRRSALRPLTTLLGATLLALLASCQQSVGFDEFDGVNLIASRGFGDTDAAGDSYWTPDDPEGIHTNWESVADVTAPSGVSGPVYRLEIPNLLANGDFEADNLGSFWSATAEASVAVGADGFTETRTLRVNQPPGQRVSLDLTEGLADDFADGARYAIHLEFTVSAQSFLLELNDGVGTRDEQNWRGIEAAAGTALEFPTTADIVAGAAGNVIATADADRFDVLSIGGFGTGTGTGNFVNGQVDNFRIVRDDVTHFVRLAIPYAEEGRPDLIPGGVITFAVWVRRDPEAGDNNRFHARRMSLGITGDAASSPSTGFVRVADTSEITEEWTRLTFAVEAPTFVVPDDPADPAYHIMIEPAASQGSGEELPADTDAGSLLVAGPTLTWEP